MLFYKYFKTEAHRQIFRLAPVKNGWISNSPHIGSTDSTEKLEGVVVK